MTQNRSSAVMQQRNEPIDSLDDFPTPPWATRALCEWLMKWGADSSDDIIEPACNRGHMVAALLEYFDKVAASDVHDYGYGYKIHDYVSGDPPRGDWTITNPPFRLAEQFIRQGLKASSKGAAVIVRTAFLEGVGRYRGLFSIHPPSDILQFSERVVMHKGKLTATGSTATSYCWIVWRKYADQGTHFHWIEPCRKRLERPSDYVSE